MSENINSKEAEPRRKQGQHISKAEKAELAEKALAMSVKGKPVTAIADELNVQWKTANNLVDFALKSRDINEDEEREKSLAHHRAIIIYCWDKLEDEKLMAHAQNRPAYIARIQASQAEIDRLNNVTPPLKVQQDINHTYRDYSTGNELEKMFEAIDGYLAERANAGDGEAGSQESVDTHTTHS